jgi:hypothetical protein
MINNKKTIIDNQKANRRDEIIRRTSLQNVNSPKAKMEVEVTTPGLSKRIRNVSIEPQFEVCKEHDIDTEDAHIEHSCWQYAADIHKYYFEVEVGQK